MALDKRISQVGNVGTALNSPGRTFVLILRWCAMGAVCLLAICCAPSCAEISYAAASHTWNLKTGIVEYRLAEREGAVYLDYFGPAGRPPWGPASTQENQQPYVTTRRDLGGQVNREDLLPGDLNLVSHEIRHPQAQVEELQMLFKHRRLPLQVEVLYRTWGQTGVLTRQVTLTNQGNHSLQVESLPSLAWTLPPGGYELTYLWGTWGRERQERSEALGPGRREFISAGENSTGQFSPWFCLRNRDSGVRFMAQLAYSGNWQMSFERNPTGGPLEIGDVSVDLGMRFDWGDLVLPPGGSLTTPLVAFTASSGDLDDAANQLHRFQREFVFAHTATNEPPLIQFNSWYPFPGSMTVADMKRCVDTAAELGAEVFVLDAGWFANKDWGANVGDWTPVPSEFPNGLEELANYVHGKGMKFGLWVEIEAVGLQSRVVHEHPDWVLSWNGKPLDLDGRYHLNFAKPEVRAWAHSEMDRLIRSCHLDWVKIDHNMGTGERFDEPDSGRQGTVMYDHVMNYYRWLDDLRAAYPALVIENCASGGMRFDLGMMAHAHTAWLSDNVDPRASVALGYGCTVEFAPEVCNHWMVGDKNNGEVVLSGPPAWWDFMLRVPMNGQFGISSQVFDWNAELKEHAKDNIAIYKRLRQVIAGADVYHLTPPPDLDHPQGWSVIQYAAPDQRRSVVLAYRLEQSPARVVVKLHGLASELRYRVSLNGQPSGSFSGQQLLTAGLPLRLEEEWRSAVIEIAADGAASPSTTASSITTGLRQ